MRPTVYLETSIISYLAAYPSRDLVTAAHQQITNTWWREHRPEFLVFASQVVLDESAAGDPLMAGKRMELLRANYDIHEFCRRLSARQGTSGHPVVKRGTAPSEISEEVSRGSNEV